MSEIIKDLENFVEIVLAKMTGDKNRETAVRNAKKARAALKGQISALESEAVNKEELLEDAEAAFKDAKYPVDPITSSEQYIRTLAAKHEQVKQARKALADVQNSLQMYKSHLDTL